MKTYTITLRDADGFEAYSTEREGIKAAKEAAKHLTSDQFYRDTESTRHAGDRVEVTNEAGEIVFDLEVEAVA